MTYEPLSSRQHYSCAFGRKAQASIHLDPKACSLNNAQPRGFLSLHPLLFVFFLPIDVLSFTLSSHFFPLQYQKRQMEQLKYLFFHPCFIFFLVEWLFYNFHIQETCKIDLLSFSNILWASYSQFLIYANFPIYNFSLLKVLESLFFCDVSAETNPNL